jgi:hypothetical protein
VSTSVMPNSARAGQNRAENPSFKFKNRRSRTTSSSALTVGWEAGVRSRPEAARSLRLPNALRTAGLTDGTAHRLIDRPLWHEGKQGGGWPKVASQGVPDLWSSRPVPDVCSCDSCLKTKDQGAASVAMTITRRGATETCCTACEPLTPLPALQASASCPSARPRHGSAKGLEPAAERRRALGAFRVIWEVLHDDRPLHLRVDLALVLAGGLMLIEVFSIWKVRKRSKSAGQTLARFSFCFRTWLPACRFLTVA